jgi:hypothetical protein
MVCVANLNFQRVILSTCYFIENGGVAMVKVRQLRVIAFAKFQGLFASLLGLVAGLLYFLVGFIVDVLVSADIISATSYSTEGLSVGTVLAFGAIAIMPLIFALLGFVFGLIEALIYNVYAGWFGAIEIGFWQ